MLKFSNKITYTYKSWNSCTQRVADILMCVTFTNRRSKVLFECRTFRSLVSLSVVHYRLSYVWACTSPNNPPPPPRASQSDEEPSAHYFCSLIIYFSWSKNTSKTVGTGVNSLIIAISKETETISDCNTLKYFSGSVYRVVQECQQLE
jgi:hypothetical protein